MGGDKAAASLMEPFMAQSAAAGGWAEITFRVYTFSDLCYNVGYEGQKSTLTCLSLFKYYYRILLF